MTTFERFERDIPTLMDEIAPPRLPDYLDDMLRQTGRTRQRPAWASLERWLPMDVVARPAPFRAPALRPLLILLLIGLLVAASLAIYAGTQRTRLPEPFGPARNGLILGSVDEDIVAFDPAAGTATTLISGASRDLAPWFSRDGQHFLFVRRAANDLAAVWVANADGSDARELVQAPVDWFEWSDSGDRVVAIRSVEGVKEISVVDVASAASTPILRGSGIYDTMWRPGHDQILYHVDVGSEGTAYVVVNADGSDPHRVAGVAAGAVNTAQFSPDGTRLAYATWGDGQSRLARVHVLDIDSGTDRLATPNLEDGYLWQDVLFSPNGTELLTKRIVPGSGAYQLAVIPADGTGEPILIGSEQPVEKGTEWAFSPDGTQVLARYDSDGSVWLFDADGSGEHRIDWSGASALTWQRLAP